MVHKGDDIKIQILVLNLFGMIIDEVWGEGFPGGIIFIRIIVAVLLGWE